jgi:hypothetical protein
MALDSGLVQPALSLAFSLSAAMTAVFGKIKGSQKILGVVTLRMNESSVKVKIERLSPDAIFPEISQLTRR